MRTRLCLTTLFMLAAVMGIAGVATSTIPVRTAIPTAAYSGMRWRMIGPFAGGRVPAVTGVPTQPDTFYFGASGGGLWKSIDAGHSWKPIFDGQPAASIGAIAVAASDPKVIYVGTGEYVMRSSIIAGNGVYKSTDAGKTWHHIGLTDTQQIGRIVIDPHDPNVAYVAALGHAYAANEERGVFRTTDGGKTWQKILYKNADTGAIDLAMDPRDSKVIYASLWQTRRPPWNVYPPASGPGSGLYKTTDGGSTWRQLTTGFPVEGVGKIGLAIAPSKPDRVYAIVDAKKGGLYRSEDGGEHWKLINAKDDLWYRGWYFCVIGVDPRDANHVWVAGLFLSSSTNGGKKFTNSSSKTNGLADYHALWIDPVDPKRMMVGADQGAIVSIDGGKSWTSNFSEPISEFYRIVTDNRDPYWIYAAQQDAGAIGLPSRTNRGGIGWHDAAFVAAGGENGYIAPDPTDPYVIFGEQGQGEASVSSEDVRFPSQYRDISPSLKFPGPHRKTWTLPIVFSMANPKALYFGQERLYATHDGGQTWEAISPILGRPNLAIPPNLDPNTANDYHGRSRRGSVFTIAPSPLRAGEIWVGTNDGKIWVTYDEGKHWRDVTPPQVTPWSKVTLIDASPHDPQTAYAAIDRHRLDDFMPYIYITHDGGRSWSLAVSGIPPGSFVNGLREDPQRAGLLYAATETAVYVSFDDGAAWHSLQQNMPVVSVRDVAVHGNDLVIATHGRSWWILDNIAPLRQMTEQIPQSIVWLFPPQTAFRVRDGYDEFSQLTPDLPSGANPPSGAIIDYYLHARSGAAVRLEILDEHGHLVRSYLTKEKKKKPAPGFGDFQGISGGRNYLLSQDAGMHRVLWDYRYAGIPNQFDGPLAPPGSYEVRLTVNGRTYSRPLELRRDRHQNVDDAALFAQFEVAQQIVPLIKRAKTLNDEAAALRDRLKKERKKASPERRKVINSLLSRIGSVMGSDPVSAPDDTDGPPETDRGTLHDVSGLLDRLYNAVESSDAAPALYVWPRSRAQMPRIDSLSARFHAIQKAVAVQRL